MEKYRKKPVVINAIQLTENNIEEVYKIVHKTNEMLLHPSYIIRNGMDIPTLEDGNDGRAKHVASIGDWIIKGVEDEFYACKPNIFEKTYEKVDEKINESLLLKMITYHDKHGKF